ncbi:MAG TPA: aldo/keto reductase [Mycobacteriales bacterium]
MGLLGPTGVEVGDFVCGAGSIGGFGSSPALRGQGMTAAEGWRQLDAAAARGIRVIDTADAYGGGESERVVGDWLRAQVAPETGPVGDRDVLVATKVGNVPDRGGVDLSAAHIRRQIRTSVERLGRVDLYLTHQPDPATPPEETLTALAELVAAGTIRAYGCCNVDRPELERLLAAADRAGLPRPGWLQNSFNLIDRRDERDLLPLLVAEGLGYTPYSPLAGGVLSDRYLDGARPAPGSRAAAGDLGYALTADVPARVRELARHAAAHGVSTAGLALAWLRTHPRVTAAIVAPRTGDQWRAVDEALALDLDDRTAEVVGALFS